VSDLVDITDEEFEQITTMVHTRFGIDLSKKRTLIRGRLNGTLRKLGYRSFAEYMSAVDQDPSGKQLLDMIDRLSTNHTFFFRESDHLEYLTNVALPTLWGSESSNALHDTRIWCAGCATGEEPYSIAITLLESLKDVSRWDVKLLATDISTRILKRAKEGIYSQLEVGRGFVGTIRKFAYLANRETPSVNMADEGVILQTWLNE